MKKSSIVIIIIISLFNSIVSFAQINTSSFGNTLTLTAGPLLQRITSIDIDGDGKNDIVGVDYSGSVSIFRNTNSGNTVSFGSKIDSTSFSGAYSATLGDLNNDGKPELVVFHEIADSIKVFINQSTPGNIFFSGSITLPVTSANPLKGIIADMDNDGLNEIVFINSGSNNIGVFKNTTLTNGGNPTFTTSVYFSISSGTPGPRDIIATDFNNDNLLDLAVANLNNHNIALYRNTSTGGVISFNTPTFLGASSAPSVLSSGDLDNDGKPELVCSSSSGLRVFKNNSTSTFSFATSFILSLVGVTDCEIVDLDNDGKREIIASNGNFNFIGVFKNNYVSGTLGTGSFSTRVDFSASGIGIELLSFEVKDYSGDNKPDLALSLRNNNTIQIFKNDIFADEPTSQATNLMVSPLGSNNHQVSFTKGNGERRIVVVRNTSSSLTTEIPQDGAMYSPSSTFGQGAHLGNNNYVVYNDTGNSFILRGILPYNTYIVNVYESKGISGYTNYLISASPSYNILQSLRIYYSKPTGALDSLGTWGHLPTGHGAPPFALNDSDVIYKITNKNPGIIHSNWINNGQNFTIWLDSNQQFTIGIGKTVTCDSLIVGMQSVLTVNGQVNAKKGWADTLSAVNYNGAFTQTMIGMDYYNLSVNGATKNLSRAARVRNLLHLNAVINNDTSIITIGKNATQVGQIQVLSGYLQGKLLRWVNSASSLVFPVGGQGNARHAQVIFNNSPASPGVVAAQFISINPGNVGMPLVDSTIAPTVSLQQVGTNGYWSLDALNGFAIGSGGYSISLTAAGFNGINQLAGLRVVNRSFLGPWQLRGNGLANSGSLSAPMVSRGLLTLFGDFGIAGDGLMNTLPVSLIQFEGELHNKVAMLKWSTSSELNASHFEIERLDGKVWQKVGRVNARGNTNAIMDYKFNYIPESANNHLVYRLKMVDLDYYFKNSRTITLVNTDFKKSFVVYPNPVKDKICLPQVYNQIKLYDYTGKEWEIKLSIEGVESYIDVSAIPQGMYYMLFDSTEPYNFIKE